MHIHHLRLLPLPSCALDKQITPWEATRHVAPASSPVQKPLGQNHFQTTIFGSSVMNQYWWRLKQAFLQHANTDWNIKISTHRYCPQHTQGAMSPSLRKAMETAVTLLTKFKAPHLLGCPLLVAIILSFCKIAQKVQVLVSAADSKMCISYYALQHTTS